MFHHSSSRVKNVLPLVELPYLSTCPFLDKLRLCPCLTITIEMSEPAKTEVESVEVTESVPVITCVTENISTDATETPAVPTIPEIPRLKVLADLFTKNSPSPRSCFVLGASGETGRRIASVLIESGAFGVVRLIVRRQVPDDVLPEPSSGIKIVKLL